MQPFLGLPLEEALAKAAEQPQIILTAAPRKDGKTRQEGTLRLIRCRDGQWVAARFLDGAPKKEPR